MSDNAILMWTDDDGDPHVRLLVGSEADFDQALEMMRRKYTDTEGFRNARIVVNVRFEPLSVIAGELDEYLAEADGD